MHKPLPIIIFNQFLFIISVFFIHQQNSYAQHLKVGQHHTVYHLTLGTVESRHSNNYKPLSVALSGISNKGSLFLNELAKAPLFGIYYLPDLPGNNRVLSPNFGVEIIFNVNIVEHSFETREIIQFRPCFAPPPPPAPAPVRVVKTIVVEKIRRRVEQLRKFIQVVGEGGDARESIYIDRTIEGTRARIEQELAELRELIQNLYFKYDF